MSKCCSSIELHRLTRHPYTGFFIVFGACTPIFLLALFDIIRGSKEAFQFVLFLLIVCAFQLIACAVAAKRNYAVASESNIYLCCKGKQTQLTWSDIKNCYHFPIPGMQVITLYYQLGEQCNGIIHCHANKDNRAFIKKMIDLYHIPSNMV